MTKGRQEGLRSLLDQPVAARLIASASDLALILDRDGKILEVSLGDAIESNPGWKKLNGKRWVETVTVESRGKVEQLLAEARNGQTSRSREINQKADGVGEIPLRFSGVLLDEDERVVAMGRDLRPLASMQQRMVSTQLAMDRDYGRLRDADTRYRVLFHVTLEGVLVVDASTRRVLECNPSAASMVGEPAAALQGKSLQEVFEPRSWPKVQGLIAAVEAGARPADIQASLLGQTDGEMTVSGLLFRQSGAALLLLRFWSASGASGTRVSRASRMLAVLESMPDGFVVTGQDRRILTANAAFCELVQQANEQQVIGEPLDRWLGRPGVDLNIMLANMREHGTIRNFSTIIRGDYGPVQEAQVTGVTALDGKVPCVGFTIRVVSSRLTSTPTSTVMPRSITQLRELVGRVPLKDLVRESADLIERLCIESALDVSGNNRASAAQLLGLSRQGLYSKLRRHGMAESDSE
jgi:transcriptional regulator PpsR